jgi:hypothetical protein
MLGDDESFVYLAAVHAMSRVVDMNRKLLIPSLLEIFAGQAQETIATRVSLKTRAALGEVLSISLRRARDLAPYFVPSIVAECVRICRHRVHLPHEATSGVDGIDANLSQMRINVSVGKAEERSDADIGQINLAIDSYSNAADSIYFRQSAYSLLSEAMACGGWTATRYLNDSLDIALGTLLLEQNHTIQENVVMRRSSVFLVKYILSSLQEKLFQVTSGGNYLKEIKRMLTVCSRDRDAVVAYQAQRGLSILDDLVKQQFVPSEEIPKIRILS